MSKLSTHVLDTSNGIAAAGVAVRLERGAAGGAWSEINRAVTDADGRVANLLPAKTALEEGAYRLVFATGAYFQARRIAAFHPEVAVHITVRDASSHYHVPLLLSPFGYTTYRGT